MEIFKQYIDVTKQLSEIEFQEGAIILRIIMHKGNPHIVYMCDPYAAKEKRKFKSYENGESIHGKYIDTVSWKDTMYHVFESEKIISLER